MIINIIAVIGKMKTLQVSKIINAVPDGMILSKKTEKMIKPI